MTVSLNPELQRFVEDQVKIGRFSSPAEVLEAGLARLMLDPPPEQFDEADRAAILRSEQQIARGEDLDWREGAGGLRRKYLRD
jgi:Arc/MetJ-type ribon-helix-helix transcriptional regulator